MCDECKCLLNNYFEVKLILRLSLEYNACVDRHTDRVIMLLMIIIIIQRQIVIHRFYFLQVCCDTVEF